MPRNSFLYSLTFIACFMFHCGCGQSKPPAELNADQLLGVNTDKKSDRTSDEKSEDNEVVSNNLVLNLKPGDRFPLLKTVEKTISQDSLNGAIKGSERIELMMAVSVVEKQQELLKMKVTYTKVKYTRELNGKTIIYDSAMDQPVIAAEARPYRGMVNNGFSFWLGSDNQIVELIDFPIFLENCLKDVPGYQRDQAVTLLAASAGKDGIANFVDDSIGLLPYNKKGESDNTIVHVGSTWSRKRNVNTELPITIEQTYSVRELTKDTARIDIIGVIMPMSTVGDSTQLKQDVELEIQKGESSGHCVIDINTGLPIESQLSQYIEMKVKLSEGVSFQQTKRIITTIKAFPQQFRSSDSIANENNPQKIQQVSGHKEE